MIRAVIFDMDGTLVDTEKLYLRFWPEALGAFGYEISRENILSLRSMGRPYAPARFKEWYGEDFDYWAVRNYRKDLMEAYIDREGIEAKPGAREALEALRARGVLTAVATATDPERTRKYLAETGLIGYFDRLISATMVPRGKPAPDIYLYACRELGLDPAECVAVEDAPNGILSAYRAGLRVIMVPDLTEPDEELSKFLYATVGSLRELPEILEKELK